MVKKKVLISGGCGFVFSNFIRLGIRYSTDYTFVSVDKVATSHSFNNIYAHNRHKFHLADVSDAHIIDKIFEFERPDIVIHGAAEYYDDSNPLIISNVLGTQVITDACVKYGVEKLIYVSTDKVYGQLGVDDKSWTEEDKINPQSYYSASKAAGELIVKAANQIHGLQYNITRCCNNYGPRQSPKNLIPKIIKNIIQKEPVIINGTGTQLKDWIHVADNSFAMMHILEKAPPNEIYNISAGHEINNLEMFHMICEIMNAGQDVHDLLTFVEDNKDHDNRYSVDFSKIKSIGWKPKFRLRKGIDMVIQWYCNNKWFLR